MSELLADVLAHGRQLERATAPFEPVERDIVVDEAFLDRVGMLLREQLDSARQCIAQHVAPKGRGGLAGQWHVEHLARVCRNLPCAAAQTSGGGACMLSA